MKAIYGLVGGMAFLLVACSSNDSNSHDSNTRLENSDEPEQQATSASINHNLNMATPAAVNCTNAGGVIALAKQLNGSSVGMCQLPDGKRCEEWALLRGACPARS